MSDSTDRMLAGLSEGGDVRPDEVGVPTSATPKALPDEAKAPTHAPSMQHKLESLLLDSLEKKHTNT